MNDSEINTPNGLAGQLAALQRQVFTLLLALIVVSGTLVAYLGYESYHLGKDIAFINATTVQPYKQRLPAIQNFINEIIAYGQAHPDFKAILVKNGVVAPAKPAAAPKK